MRRSVNARTLTTKSAIAGEFAHHGSGYVLGGFILAAAAARTRRGRLTGADVRAVATVAALQPVFEWALHRGVLHAPAVRLAGHTVDPGAAHRGHHQVPDDVAGALLGIPCT